MHTTQNNSIHDFKIVLSFAPLTARGVSPAVGSFALRSKKNVMNFLANSKSGRLILHVWCFLRCPRHAHWHWQGIIREFAH